MARVLKAVVAAVALPALTKAQGADPVPLWLNPEKQANVANCVVDIGIALTFLGKAGVGINAAIETCDKKGDTTAACTASITGLISGFAYGAAFISAAAAECSSSLQVVEERSILQEGCSAVVSVLTATLTLMANAGASIKDVCPGVRSDISLTGDESTGIGERRLSKSTVDPAQRERLAAIGRNKTYVWEKLEEAREKLKQHGIHVPESRRLPVKPKPAKPNKPTEKPITEGDVRIYNGRTDARNAACAFDVGQFTFLSARAGLMINYAVKDCSQKVLYEGGNLHQAKCITDVGRAIGAFGYTASGIAFAVYECPDIVDNLDAACAGSIINLIAGTVELVGNGADLANTCVELAKPERQEEHDEHDIFDPERRLSSAETAPANWV